MRVTHVIDTHSYHTHTLQVMRVTHMIHTHISYTHTYHTHTQHMTKRDACDCTSCVSLYVMDVTNIIPAQHMTIRHACHKYDTRTTHVYMHIREPMGDILHDIHVV